MVWPTCQQFSKALPFHSINITPLSPSAMKIKHRKPQTSSLLPIRKHNKRIMGQPGKWVALVAAIWIQAFAGTNFDFPSYSSDLKAALGMSQLELNYLAVASDLGKAFGWCSGVFLLYFPLWVVMLMAASMGFLGYGLQWLLLQRIVSLPYFLVYLLCLVAGCSICWFNTVCYVSCIQNFQANRALALSLIVSFNGVSAAFYTLIANAIDPNDASFYLFLNALVPLIISALALLPILHQPPVQSSSADASRHDSPVFLCLYITAVITGLYLIIFNSMPSDKLGSQILLAGAIALLLVPLCLPGILTRKWLSRIISASLSCLNSSRSNLVDHELHQELITVGTERNGTKDLIPFDSKEKDSISRKVMEKENLVGLEEEHPVTMLVQRLDFWLYYVAYFCGGTIGLVYSNNLGQISQSLGYSSLTSSLVTLYSSCSFFGRLISATPDFMREKVYFPRTGWLAIALVPTPIAFILLAASASKIALQAGTGLIGLSSGFIFSASVSITSELFGPNSAGVNHNILITNIPLGSFLYGVLAAVAYDSTAGSSHAAAAALGDAVVCIGRKCYLQTFIWWACISLVGLASSFLLFRRTKPAYDRHFESNLKKTQPF